MKIVKWSNRIWVLAAVVAIVVGAVVYERMKGANDGARLLAAQLGLKSVQVELLKYQRDTGTFPSTEQGLQALVTPPKDVVDSWKGPYIDGLPVDPWERPYQYTSADASDGFVISSLGPEGDGQNRDLKIEGKGFLEPRENATDQTVPREQGGPEESAEDEQTGAPFHIETSPANARVRIMNIADVYQDGMELPPEEYRVEVSATGFYTKEEVVPHGMSATTRQIVLDPTSVPFTLDNQSDDIIWHVYARPDYEEAWGVDLLGKGESSTISSRNQHRFDVRGRQRHCIFDIRVEWTNGFYRTFMGRDLCENPDVVFDGGRGFVVFNESRTKTISEVKARPDVDESWGLDRLDEVIASGRDRVVMLEEQYKDHCTFDIQLWWSRQDNIEFHNRNLCDDPRIAFFEGDELTVKNEGEKKVVVKPRVMEKVEPTYPSAAERNGTEGYIVLGFTVTPTGRVKDIIVVESVPRGVFDRAARAALNRQQYAPKTVDGKPVEAPGQKVKFIFNLPD